MSVWLEVVYRAFSETISNVLHFPFSSGDLVKDCLGCWPNDAEIIVFKISKKTKRKEQLAYSIEYFISTNKEISTSRKKLFSFNAARNMWCTLKKATKYLQLYQCCEILHLVEWKFTQVIMVKISETDGERKQNFWFFKLFSKIVFIFSSAVYYGCIENLESSQHSNVFFFMWMYSRTNQNISLKQAIVNII